MVPRLRTCGSPMLSARVASAGIQPLTSPEPATSAWVVSAPIKRLLPRSTRIRPSSLTPPRSITSDGLARRCLSVGIRVMPPASSTPSPAPLSKETASATLVGRWYSNAYIGRASLFGRLRQAPVLQRAPDFFRSRRHGDADADRVGDGV